MKKTGLSLFIVVIFCFSSADLNAQVKRKSADKWQLIDGVRLKPRILKKNLIKVKATKVSPSIKSKGADNIRRKKYRKPLKVNKYSNQKLLRVIKKEDDE